MKPFTFYDIYYAPLKELDDKHAGKFFRMICDFLDGKLATIDAERDEEVSPEFELYWESILSDLEAYRSSAGKSCGLDKRYKHFPFLPFYRKAFAYLSYDEGGAFVKMIGAYMFETKRRQRQTATPSSISTSANVSWTRANSGCKTARKAADRRRIKTRRKSTVYPKSTTRLHGKRTKTFRKPTTKKPPARANGIQKRSVVS